MRKTLFILSLLLVCFAQTAKAEISSPYVIDEKPQVLFGDSVLISATSTYHGLENYIHDYVGGFLHISFSYTHHQCCVASFPPAMYVTNADPQTTTTLTIRELYPVHTLASQPVDLTDWYAYDVQFDNSGYTLVVKKSGEIETTNFHREIAGLSEGDWASLANRYPRQDPLNSYSMSFAPLRIWEQVVAPVATRTPVIIVPGIVSTQLNNSDGEKWPNLTLMALSFEDLYLNDLILNSDGENLNLIQPTSMIRSLVSHDFFNGLFGVLGTSGYEENIDLYEYPYDWRLDIGTTVQKLKEKIDEIKIQTGVQKVDLVAHSMGGLLVKKYLKEYGGNSVNKFVDVGTPHTGAPKAFKILNYGDNFGFEKLGLDLLSPKRAKEISQNMPAVYELLPSRSYFDDSDNSYKYYVFNAKSGQDRLSFEQTGAYLKSSGRNSSLIDRADAFHQEIDNLNPANFGVETYNIVGCGTPTIGQFYILDDSQDHPIYNIRMINGDGTVPLRSAEAMTASTTYYVRNATHALMPSMSGVKELVAGLLSVSGTPVDISSYSNLSLSSSGCTIPNGKMVSFHSPIDLHIYDQSSNHVGPDSNGDIENNIPGVVYEVIEGNKFAYLPEGVEYVVRGNATSAGSFDVRIQEVVNGEVATTTLFTDIPLTLNTQAQFSLGVSVPNQISLDNGNDGAYETVVSASTSTAGIIASSGKVAQSSPPVVVVRAPRGESRASIIWPLVISPPTPQVQALQATKRYLKVEPVKPAIRTAGEETTVIQPERYDDTAIVYKSLNHRVSAAIGRLWSWFRSKI